MTATDSIDAAVPRAALVTGAAIRIGRAIAEDLAAAGYAVAIHYRSSAKDADSAVAAIQAKGGKAIALKADLALEDETMPLIEKAQASLGPIGVLINNASVFEPDEAGTATRASWDLHLEANLRAPFVLTQEFARQLPPKAEGVVVNLLDQRVWNLSPFFMSYTVSKSALWTLTRTMALGLAPRIRVNAIGPGPTLPNERQTAEHFQQQLDNVPLGRGATLSEICSAVRFIIGARSMTGQMIALDGGQHLGWNQSLHGPHARH
jgi:NAD(P)-dependent dehydrogenase (short-subunit alcohol dehydrogenase family)